MNRLTTASRLGLTGAALLLGACGKKPDATAGVATVDDSTITVTEAQRARIQTAPVASQSFLPTIATTGTVNFNGDKSTAVIPAISGPVSRILVQPGDIVHPGQVLAFVVSPDFAGYVAEFRKAEAAWHNAQRIVTLDEKLFANDALARADLDQARSDLSTAAADRESALLQLGSLGIDSASIEAIRQGKAVPGAQAAIRSPIAGTVVEKLITQGQLLQAGSGPAFTVADLSSVWVMGNVFETMIASVSNGDLVMITTDVSSDSFPGRVDNVAALVDPTSKATQVRILVPNPKRILRQNMLVHVVVKSSRRMTGIVIPVDAVLRDDDNLPFVYLTAGALKFTRHRITLGRRTGESYEITEGLAVGDTVVTDGALFLEGSSAP